MTWSAELRYHGEYGVEAQILRNGDLSIARTFFITTTVSRHERRDHVRMGRRRFLRITARQEVEVHMRGDFESNPRCLIEMTLRVSGLFPMIFKLSRWRDACYAGSRSSYPSRALIRLGVGAKPKRGDKR